MIKLETVPNGKDEIIQVYGSPHDLDFWQKYMKIFDLPYPMRLSWELETKVSRIWIHKKIGAAVVNALTEIKQFKSYYYLVENDLEVFGGCYNLRSKRKQEGKISTHGWGIAVDINPHIAPFGEPGKQPQFIVNAFVKRGFIWGGAWQPRDDMHFQACKGY